MEIIDDDLRQVLHDLPAIIAFTAIVGGFILGAAPVLLRAILQDLWRGDQDDR